MKNNKMKLVLVIYDLFLALGAIYGGIGMISGRLGDYPTEWLNRVPFTNWIIPGFIAIVFYGLGNLIAGIFTLSKGNKGIVISLIMGVIFFISLLISISVLGDIYLATAEFILFSIIQIILSILTFVVANRKKRIS